MADQGLAVFEIKNYMVIWRQLEKRDFAGVQALIRGLVRCSGVGMEDQQSYRLDVYRKQFLSPESDMPAPQVDIEQPAGREIFMTIGDMDTPLSISCAMRSRSLGICVGDFPQWTSVTTTNEPVGTGDEDHRFDD